MNLEKRRRVATVHRNSTLEGKGFSKSTISKMLYISRPTVIKYLKMCPQDF
jgi:predicted transcriptional regulator